MALQDVLVPDIGNYKNVPVIEILVKVGDTLKQEQSLITLETDKATMEVPSPVAGVVKALKVKVGDKISQGDLILQVEAEAAATKDAPKTETPQTTKAAAPSIQEIRVPDIGNYKNVPVIELAIKAGAKVNKEQTLFTLETDKAMMEVPSPLAGEITEVKIKVGDKISQGDLVAMIKAEGSAGAPAAAPQKPATAPAAPAPIAAPAAPPAPGPQPFISYAYVHAGPAVRQFARELGADLSKIGGTGYKNRVTRDDVVRFVKAELAKAAQGGSGLNLLPDPEVNFAEYGKIKVEKLPRIKKISGANLYRNWIRVPHITLMDEADITELEVLRKNKKADAEKQGIKLTPLPFLVKAVAGALKEFPLVNSSLSNDGESLVYKEYIHIGVAVDTPNGLYVPVIRNADQKGILDIAKELGELSQKAKDGKIKPIEMQGGTFTISSLGSLGTTSFTPIVNMPEVGILGVSKADMKPKWDGKAFQPRLMLPLSLSLDHRVVDGAEGARFLSFLTKALADLSELLL
jgi:pyruvate dehydrogenase E2 component (dihydrolipoamide acetyltransferase)